MHELKRKDLLLLAGAAVLLLPALLINLGLVPLYLEEPRRAAVALEMILRENWIVPTLNGEPYYLKPPLFNWIIALLYKLTGNYGELLARVPAVISFLALGLVIFLAGKRYVSPGFGAISAMLFLTAAGNLFFNALLAEIDMFYSLVTFTSLLALFHFHQRRRYLALFLSVYFLGAVGFLTKGMPSLLYTGLSLLAYFIARKDFRALFSWKHLAGLFVFFLAVGGYFFAYHQNGDALQYLQNLFFESGKRVSGETFLEYLRHMALYPLDTLMNLLPASLLVIFLFRRRLPALIRQNPLMMFSLLMLAVHFPVYWLPPGGRQRYIIMLYPFIIYILTYLFLPSTGNNNRQVWVRPLIIIIYAMAVLRIVFNLTVLPVRAVEGNTPANKLVALEIDSIAKGNDVVIVTGSYIPMQTTFYLERARMEIVPYTAEVVPGAYHLIAQHLLEPLKVRKDIGPMLRGPHQAGPDPFDAQGKDWLSGYSIREKHPLVIQKHRYNLVMPVRPHP